MPPPASYLLRPLARWLARLLLRVQVSGQANVPASGGVLLAINHLGGADPVLVIGFTPRYVTPAGKSEIQGWPVFNRVAAAYGMIPLRRGEPDRATLRRLLSVMAQGGALLIAPEGRESLTGALERAKDGAAFLGLRAGVPVVPVAITGTAWKRVLPAWRRLRRPCVTLTFGMPFRFPAGLSRREATEQLMHRLASMLPPEYRGAYADDSGGLEPAAG